MARLLIVPSLGNAPMPLWLARLGSLHGAPPVQQPMQSGRALDAWVDDLDRAIRDGAGPCILVAHGLGCAGVVRWVGSARGRGELDRNLVAGALLVAPTNAMSGVGTGPGSGARPSVATAAALPFPCRLIVSRDDPHGRFEDAQALAEAWGATLVDAGAGGHLDADALGSWPFGQRQLAALTQQLPFELDSRLARDTHWVGTGELSELRLMDDKRYPWLLLVPRVAGISDATELSPSQARILDRESRLVSNMIHRLFEPDKLNTAALGNVVRQLHVHHVARQLDDPAWPGPVWGHSPAVHYGRAEREGLLRRLRDSPLGDVFVRRLPS